MCEFEATLRKLNAVWCVEADLVTAAIPQPDGGVVCVSVEALPVSGWDWTVWRAGGTSEQIWSGSCADRCEAFLAAQSAARRLRLALVQSPGGQTWVA